MTPGPHHHPLSQARAPARPIPARARGHATPLPPRSRRPGPACTVGRVAVLATLATLLAGCSRVAVPDPTPDEAGSAVCGALMADLPDQVLDQDRRTVEPGRFSAAWGKPAIVLRCGVAAPPTLTKGSECLDVNGTGWFREDATGGTIFTTIGRATFVEVSVPTQYPLGYGALVDLGATVSTHDPLVTPCR